jgi:hypothetical protein
MKYLITYVTLFLISTQAYSQSFINGDLEGVVDQFNPGAEPPGWTEVPFTSILCESTHLGGDTPDITGINGPIVGNGMYGSPYSGTTFVSGLYAQSDTSIWHEGIQQTVTSFVLGENYTIGFYQANVKQSSASTFNAIDESGSWEVFIDGISIGITSPTYSSLPYNSSNFNWEYREVTFTATSSEHTIAFMPADDDLSIDASIDEGLRMGIDAIELQLVVGIDEVEPIEVSVFPNPCQERFKIEFNVQVDAQITLTDGVGRILNEIRFTGKELELNVAGKSGLYFLTIKYSDGEQDHFNILKSN